MLSLPHSLLVKVDVNVCIFVIFLDRHKAFGYCTFFLSISVNFLGRVVSHDHENFLLLSYHSNFIPLLLYFIVKCMALMRNSVSSASKKFVRTRHISVRRLCVEFSCSVRAHQPTSIQTPSVMHTIHLPTKTKNPFELMGMIKCLLYRRC